MTNQQGAPEALRLPVQTLMELHQGLANNLHDGPARNLHLATVAALVEAQQPAPSAAAADTVVLEAALRAIHQAIDLIGEPDTERLRTVRRVLRGAVVVAEDSNAPQADSQPAVQQWNDLIGKETHADADGLLVWRDEVDFAIPTPQADSQPAPADVEDAIAWLVTWKGGEHTYAHAHASELPAINQARIMGGTVTPCVAARAPEGSVTAPAAFQRALDIRTAQGWKLGGDKIPVLYTDTINGEQVCRDDIWLCTTAAFATPPAQAADSVLEDAALLQEARTALWQPANVDLCERIDAYLDAARKQGGAT